MKDESLNEFTQLKREMDGCDLEEIAIYISLRTPRRTPPPLTCSRSPIPKGSRSATTCLARILPAHMRTARQRTWRHNRAARGGSSGGRRKAEGATNGIIIPEVNVASPADRGHEDIGAIDERSVVHSSTVPALQLDLD